MSDSGKDSLSDQRTGRPFVPDNVARAIHQRLVSLKSAGIAELPKSTDELKFPGLVLEKPKTQNTAPSIVAERPASKTKYVSPPNVQKAARPAKKNATRQPTPSEIPVAGYAGGALFPPAENYGPGVPVEERATQLEVIQQEVAGCTACPELAATRKQTVFGVGAVHPRLVFLGEAPGADEDRQGEPFVGAAGQLLTKIIEAMKLSREEVYILNTLKCRPPGNRNPLELELRNCCDFSIRQLEILQPEFICCLGSIAAKTLLNTKQSIGRLRGQFYKWRGSRVLATYHPAYLLRSPDAKKHVWNDMKLIMAEMGME